MVQIPPACYFHIASAFDLLFIFVVVAQTLFDSQSAFCDIVQTDAQLETTIHKLKLHSHRPALLLLWHTPDLLTLAPVLQKDVENFFR